MTNRHLIYKFSEKLINNNRVCCLMVQLVVWSITFLTLWLTLIWLHFLNETRPVKRVRGVVSVGIPVFSRNNDKDAIKTIRSVFASGYPVSLLDVIVVDDGSTDDTYERLLDFKKKNSSLPLKIFTQKNKGKAGALNVALKAAKGEFFAVMDADSRISRGSIQSSLNGFSDKNVGSVISRVRVDNAKSFIEKLQKVEYIMSAFIRKVMSNFGTLAMTPGVLSVYRVSVLRSLGGFDANRENLTEDLEIALRLRSKGYNISMAPDSVTYTEVPKTMKSLWRQRVRWSRGYIFNHINYRNLLFSSKHGVFGMFQLPVNVIAVILLVINSIVITFDVGRNSFDFIYRSLTINNYFWTTVFDWPSLQEFVLARDVQIGIPLILVLLFGVYLWYVAHRFFKEPMKENSFFILGYLIFMPYFTALNWISSLAHEVFRTKRKW